MIDAAAYFKGHMNHPGINNGHRLAFAALAVKVNRLLSDAYAAGVPERKNPSTGTCISGRTNGGWRPMDCPEGSKTSSHKAGRGVDIYDPFEELEKWITDSKLAAYGLYREHPDDTHTWVHLTDRPPGSGNRTFKP